MIEKDFGRILTKRDMLILFRNFVDYTNLLRFEKEVDLQLEEPQQGGLLEEKVA